MYKKTRQALTRNPKHPYTDEELETRYLLMQHIREEGVTTQIVDMNNTVVETEELINIHRVRDILSPGSVIIKFPWERKDSKQRRERGRNSNF